MNALHETREDVKPKQAIASLSFTRLMLLMRTRWGLARG